MTREFYGRFSPAELILAVVSTALIIGALVWVFTGDGTEKNWRWLMLAALVTTVAGRQIRHRRLERQYGGDNSPTRR